jgi:DNA-binding beta-propeller fold protein YncE
VNNPAKNEVDVIDRHTRAMVARWPVTLCRRNVSMVLDESSHRLFSACRSGAIVVFDTRTAKELQALPIGKGVDDLIFDPATRRIYASCGADGGAIYVYREEDPDHYKSLGRVPSAPGGKNEVLVPELGSLFVTIPPHPTTPGDVYVYQVP